MFERSGTLMQRKFREYLLPTVLTSVAISLANIVNSIIVGNFIGETALAAIGLATPVVYCINALFLLYIVGGVTCASVARGRRETDSANLLFSLTFIAGIASMIVLLIVLLVFMKPICLALTQGDADLAELVSAYLTPMAFVGPVLMLVIGIAQFVRIDGKPRIAAYIAITANLVNLALAVVFIRFLDMGIGGAGLATVLGYTAGILMLLPYLFSKQRSLVFKRPSARDFTKVARIVSAGSPKALMQAVSFLRTLTLNALIVATLGSPGMTAMTVCASALVLTTMFVAGTNDTLLPIVGTLFGERDYKGIQFTVRTGLKFMIAASAVLMVLFVLFPTQVGILFGVTSPEGLAIVEPALRMYALSLPFYGINVLLQVFYQTTGRVKLALLLVFLEGFGFVVLFAFLLSVVNADLIWLAFAFAEIATLLLVLCIAALIRKKEGATGILLLPKEEESEVLLDFSIPATVEAATGLSEQVIRFCEEMGTRESDALRVGVAVEEMAVNTALYGHRKNKGVIDVSVRITSEELILRLRDDGISFDPTKYHPEEEHDFLTGGIEVVKSLTKDISYTRQLGFNVCIITVPHVALQDN